MTTIVQTEMITVDIVEKEGPCWRIIGSCPESVSWSGGLHVYRGRHAVVRDCATDEAIVSGRSLDDVLRKLAVKSGMPVVLTDEYTWQERRFEPTGGDAR